MSFYNSDYEIIKNILGGNENDFEKIVDKYQQKVFSIIGKRIPQNDVSDVAQEVFVRIYKGLPNYTPIRPFENWLSVITLRCCHDFWRQKGRTKELAAPNIDYEKHFEWLDKASINMSHEAFLKASQSAEAKELLDWALAKLSPDDRTLIEMIHLDGYSFKEAAEVLEWNLSKSKVRALRARKKLKTFISKYTELVNYAQSRR